jgi:hypothetical protein
MEIHKLSDTQVKNAKPQVKDYRLSDGGALYLVVKPSGGKLWRWSYEFNGKEKLLSYGPYPAVSLAEYPCSLQVRLEINIVHWESSKAGSAQPSFPSESSPKWNRNGPSRLIDLGWLCSKSNTWAWLL